MKPPVVIGIATIEARKESLKDTLDSLSGQCTAITVYHNEMDVQNSIMMGSTAVNHYGGSDYAGDIGDIGKFYEFMDNVYGSMYILVCDDDLIYPPDYVETLIAGIERHDRKAVVGFHGKEYYAPVESYYRSFRGALEEGSAKNFRCLDYVDCSVVWPNKAYGDNPSTVIGTGCTGWHSSLFKDNPLSMDDFGHPNMADIWFSKKCNEMGIPRYVIPHEAGWITHTDKIDMRETIASTAFNDDAIQTEVFNSVDWKL